RKEACEKNEVAQGYFSIILRKVLETHEIVKSIIRYYNSDRNV
ncbi:TPA: PapB/FocB family fimbrial expression transcriptional regulator, partial [Escherichia coli]